jgi:hypothetical protein
MTGCIFFYFIYISRYDSSFRAGADDIWQLYHFAYPHAHHYAEHDANTHCHSESLPGSEGY